MKVNISIFTMTYSFMKLSKSCLSFLALVSLNPFDHVILQTLRRTTLTLLRDAGEFGARIPFFFFLIRGSELSIALTEICFYFLSYSDRARLRLMKYSCTPCNSADSSARVPRERSARGGVINAVR